MFATYNNSKKGSQCNYVCYKNYLSCTNICGENVCGFFGFSFNRECFPAFNGLVDQQYKSKEMLQ